MDNSTGNSFPVLYRPRPLLHPFPFEYVTPTLPLSPVRRKYLCHTSKDFYSFYLDYTRGQGDYPPSVSFTLVIESLYRRGSSNNAVPSVIGSAHDTRLADTGRFSVRDLGLWSH